MNESRISTRSRDYGPPCMTSLLTVVDGIDPDIVAEPKTLRCHHTRCLISSNTYVPPTANHKRGVTG